MDKKRSKAIKAGIARAKAKKVKVPSEALLAASDDTVGMVWDSENRRWNKAVDRTQASKDDTQKVMLSLFPVRALVETCKVFTYGAAMTPRPDGSKGYGVGNWHSGNGFDWQRLMDAAIGHKLAFQLGDNYDKDSGYHHLAHEMCCNAMLLEHFLTNLGDDTREKAQHFSVGEYPVRTMRERQ